MYTIYRHVVAVIVALVALQATAFAAGEPQAVGRNFNHMVTGFPLTGGHATADCATCHVGGTFKGTPKTCDGCHAVGRRVIATPKSSRHIVTNDPCEICHSNTITFLGAKFNHGTVPPGTCTTCHNGVVSTGRPANHNAGNKLTQSCDQCHRTTAWLPASWNHNGVTTGCGTCHVAGGQASSVVPVHPIHAMLPALSAFGPGIVNCENCHTNFYTFTSHRLNHAAAGASSTCGSCHNAANKAQSLGVINMLPAGHIPYTATLCEQCHTNAATWATVVTGNTLHGLVSVIPCTACHDTTSQCNAGGGAAACLGTMTKKRIGSHEGSRAGQDCISCHSTQYTRWNKP